jgi:uncharacterized membrane protein
MYTMNSDISLAACWNSRGKAAELPPLLGDTHAYPAVINDEGVIAGTSSGSDYTAHPVLWTCDGRVTPLTLPAGVDSLSGIVGLGNEGSVVANFYPGKAVIWNASSKPRILEGPPGTQYSTAVAMNRNGEIIGSVSDGKTESGVVWDRRGRVRPLSTFFGETGLPKIISGDGMIVGTSGDPFYYVKWDWRGGISKLAILPAPEWTTPVALNDAGQIVGTGWKGHWSWAPVWWNRTGKVAELSYPTGVYFCVPVGINNHGTVIGNMDFNGNRIPVMWRVVG